jgi:hypothetical protein
MHYALSQNREAAPTSHLSGPNKKKQNKNAFFKWVYGVPFVVSQSYSFSKLSGRWVLLERLAVSNSA